MHRIPIPFKMGCSDARFAFYRLFTFVSGLVIWDGLLSRSDANGAAAFSDFIEFMIKKRMEDSLSFLMERLDTVVHTMKYFMSRGPIHGGKYDFTDIANLLPHEKLKRRRRKETSVVIDELMRLTDPRCLQFNEHFQDFLGRTLSFISRFSPNPYNSCRATQNELSITHNTAIAEILYVNLFECRENVRPEEISPEIIENFIRTLNKSILAGVMCRLTSGRRANANDIDSFLKKTDSLEIIKKNQLLREIQQKSNNRGFQLDIYHASLILSSLISSFRD